MKHTNKVFSNGSQYKESMHGGNIDEPERVVHIEEAPKKKGNQIRKYALERQQKFLKIILRLAAINGYDENGRIKLPSGTYMENSDIVTLLGHSLTPGRNISGLKEFVDLLAEAGVSDDLVINENVKQMLQKSQGFQKRPNSKLAPHVDLNVLPDAPKSAKKRTYEEVEDGEPQLSHNLDDADLAPQSRKRKRDDNDPPPMLGPFPPQTGSGLWDSDDDD